MGSYYDKLRALRDEYNHTHSNRVGNYYDNNDYELRATLRDEYNHTHSNEGDNYSYNNGYNNSLWDKKQKDKDDEYSSDKKQKDTNKNVNIINVNVNCCDHKKDEDKKDWKSLYKKEYWDYKEEKYKEY